MIVKRFRGEGIPALGRVELDNCPATPDRLLRLRTIRDVYHTRRLWRRIWDGNRVFRQD